MRGLVSPCGAASVRACVRWGRPGSDPARYGRRVTELTGAWTREVLRELVGAWPGGTGKVVMQVREHELIGLAVYGMTAHTYALARAVLALDDGDHEAGVTPLVRQAVECATTAIWLEQAGLPAVLTMIREQTRQQRNVITEFVKSGQTPNDEVTQRLTADLEAGLRSTAKAGEKFEERCTEISGGANIYAIYRALSGTSHASTSIVDLYLESTQVEENTTTRALELRRTPKPGQRDAELGIILSMLIAASSAWSRLDRDRYMRTRLKELCRDLKIPFKHSLTTYGLAKVRVREQEHRVTTRPSHPRRERATT